MTCQNVPPPECIVCDINTVGAAHVGYNCVGSGGFAILQGWWCHSDGKCRQQAPGEGKSHCNANSVYIRIFDVTFYTKKTPCDGSTDCYPSSECDVCDGRKDKPQTLKLRWVAHAGSSSPVTFAADDLCVKETKLTSNSNSNEIVLDATSCYGSGEKLPTNIYFKVDGSSKYLHASCSQPLNMGQEVYSNSKGSLIVSGFQSVSGRTERACNSNKNIVSPVHLQEIIVYNKNWNVIAPFTSKRQAFAPVNDHDHDHDHSNAGSHNHYHDDKNNYDHNHNNEHDDRYHAHYHAHSFDHHYDNRANTRTSNNANDGNSEPQTHNHVHTRTSSNANDGNSEPQTRKHNNQDDNDPFAGCYYVNNQDKDTGICMTRGTPWVEFGYVTNAGISRIVVHDRERRIKTATLAISVKEYATDGFCYTTTFGNKEKHTFDGKLALHAK